MPVFEFRCKKCQAITEILCWGAGLAKHRATCGQCGSKATVKGSMVEKGGLKGFVVSDAEKTK